MREFYYKSACAIVDLVKAAAMVDPTEEDHGIRAVAKAEGVPYQALWAYVYWDRCNTDGTAVDLSGMAQGKADKVVASMRADGVSWGLVMSRCNLSEGQARRAYERSTNIQSVGTRTGSGGRYWADDERLYSGEGPEGNRATHGPKVPVGTAPTAAVATVNGQDQRDLADMTVVELRSLLPDNGPKGARKPALLKLVAAALVE